MATRATDHERYPTLSVEQAQAQVLAAVQPLPAESLPLLEALGRVLAEDIVAAEDIPPHANAAMDGYALRHEDIAGASPEKPAWLQVVGELPAGARATVQLRKGEAVRIMTGAPIPSGADTVVRFEDTHAEGMRVCILRDPGPGRNVRAAGEDVRRGEVALAAGTLLRPQELGMLAALGRVQVRVHRRPRVAILATGDELLPPEAPLSPGKIRDANSYSVAGQVLQAGGIPILLGIARDSERELRDKLEEALALAVDLIVTSGGVSAGDFDLVKEVLRSLGRMEFWWVNMKPGRPLAFGTLGSVPLLALPGNPVSAMVAFHLFGRPMLYRLQGRSDVLPRAVFARLREPIERKDGRRHYLRVRLLRADGVLEAELTGEQGSGILSSMTRSDGLAVIPEDCQALPAGSTVQVLLLE
jgi:molybdopterin molybdotransferase